MFDAIEKGLYNVKGIDKIVGSNNYRIGFSDAHIHEVNTMTGYDGKTKEEVVERRLLTIAKVTQGIFYNRTEKHFEFRPGISPMKRYEELKGEFMTKQQIVDGFQKEMSDEKRKQIKDFFAFDTQELNNLPKDQVLHYIRDKMAAKGVSYG